MAHASTVSPSDRTRKAKRTAPVVWPVSISKAAQLAGISARMARHYESLQLLPHVGRTDSGYRLYSESDVHTLRFIRRSRDLGFSMEEIQTLVNLWNDKQRASASVAACAASGLAPCWRAISNKACSSRLRSGMPKETSALMRSAPCNHTRRAPHAFQWRLR